MEIKFDILVIPLREVEARLMHVLPKQISGNEMKLMLYHAALVALHTDNLVNFDDMSYTEVYGCLYEEGQEEYINDIVDDSYVWVWNAFSEYLGNKASDIIEQSDVCYTADIRGRNDLVVQFYRNQPI